MDYVYSYSRTPFQVKMTMVSDGNYLTGLWFDDDKNYSTTPLNNYHAEILPVFDETIKWLDIYFSGNNPQFLPPLKIETTPFRQMISDIMLTIPYGQTMTYKEIANIAAKQTGRNSMSPRAVGNAVGKNRIVLIVPCHRVVRSDGKLGGYSGGGGSERKQYLLDLESN